jgi:catechol 2,3-dioxygenase-like lactoylglutathione lyase family enzyme
MGDYGNGRNGLHDRLNRISHYDVNVTDLERSIAFYEATTCLRRTGPAELCTCSFRRAGIDRGVFRSCTLRSPGQRGSSAGLQLIEWLEPRPVGSPYTFHGNVGWYRIVIWVSDLSEARQRVIRAGGKPYAENTDALLRIRGEAPGDPVSPYRVFAVADPDGITVEFAEGVPECLSLVAHNTADIENGLGFYTDILGLDFFQGVETPDPVPNVYSAEGGMTRFVGAFMHVRGDDRIIFDWLQWEGCEKYLVPYKEVNHVGIARCAVEVDDINACLGILERSRWNGKPVPMLDEVVTVEKSGRAGPRVLNFSDPEGVGFQLVEQPQYVARLHPFAAS